MSATVAAPAGRETVSDAVEYEPRGPLAGLVHGVGYEQRGFPPGTHRGLPSRHVTFVIPFEDPLELSGSFIGGRRHHIMDTCVGGLHTLPVTIHHTGTQVGVQLAVTPAGARPLFGVPAAELAATVVDLTELWGHRGAELTDRVRGAGSWRARFAVLDDVLGRIVSSSEATPTRPEVSEAWRLLTQRRGTPVAAVAKEVGWSRRHLTHRFAAEFGVAPKQLDRIVRFERASSLLKRPDRPRLADVAADSGYADQAHMSREWRELAGCPPSEWLATEVLPFVQDLDAPPRA